MNDLERAQFEELNADYDYILSRLNEVNKKLELYDKIFLHSFASDKVGDRYFICGELGQKDNDGLPDKIMICPAYGCDWFTVYEKTNVTAGTEW